MELIYANVKNRIDSAAAMDCGGVLRKVILTNDEFNELTREMAWNIDSAHETIGYRKIKYNGIIVEAKER